MITCKQLLCFMAVKQQDIVKRRKNFLAEIGRIRVASNLSRQLYTEAKLKHQMQ